MNFLSLLPLSRQRLAVLFEIYADGETYLRAIARKLHMNPSLAFSILRKLTEAQAFAKRKVGKEVMYSLQQGRDSKLMENILEEFYLQLALERSKTVETAVNLLVNNREVMGQCSRIYLFGSAVAGALGEGSDIDLLFVTENKKAAIAASREISTIIQRQINPLIYSRASFQNELKKKEPLLDSIINKARNRAIIK